MDDKRQKYSAKQTQTGKSPGMGTSSRRSNYNPGGGLEDSKRPSDSGRKQQAAFLQQNPAATLNILKREGVPTIPFGVPGGQVLNILKPFRDRLLGANVDYFSDLKNRLQDDPNRNINNYERSAAGYKQYMADRLAGKIDAAGNLLRVSQDDSGIMPLLNDPNLQNPNMNMMNQGLGSLIGAPQVINNEYIYGLPMGFMR